MANVTRRTLDNNTYTLDQQIKHKQIMFISDQIELAETLQMELSGLGYQVSVIHDGLRGLLAVNRMKPDLVILSWSPPRLSGLEICDRLRSSRHEEAIILLTESDCHKQRIAGFNAGADDCLSWPLAKEEFIARVQANLNYCDHGQRQSPILRCTDLLLNRDTREVFRNQQLIRLTATEFNLLEYLMTHYFQVLTRSQILENVWGYDYAGSSNIIEVYIRYLRKKLGATSENPLIHTVRGVGYILREAA